MTTPLTLATSRRPDGTVVLTATGEIDMSNAAALAEALTRAATGQTPLLVDLTAVDYLDSAGLTTLFEHAERIQLIAPPLLTPVLTVSGLAELTTVHSYDPAARPDGEGPPAV
ncbi:anti-anti-sigma factor [Microtetraspora sp. NBRC 13810]|uniref:STAS domain-containing protein n=1 Tax=Microtetraspora sp. NBRC 13810 TaxID=3030990 RepID=UPI0024A49492|nr:STAS domain-containing protein [Microtetraspora sp. NBRC 13810]GLW09108.1 anti-anti-sigma factor [Microtetraspora sp. NBRC 13810]